MFYFLIRSNTSKINKQIHQLLFSVYKILPLKENLAFAMEKFSSLRPTGFSMDAQIIRCISQASFPRSLNPSSSWNCHSPVSKYETLNLDTLPKIQPCYNVPGSRYELYSLVRSLFFSLPWNGRRLSLVIYTVTGRMGLLRFRARGHPWFIQGGIKYPCRPFLTAHIR